MLPELARTSLLGTLLVMVASPASDPQPCDEGTINGATTRERDTSEPPWPGASNRYDLLLGQLYGLLQYGRVGSYPNGESGFSAASTACNNSAEYSLPWYAPMRIEHPTNTLNVYRLSDGRLVQIGAHWMMHGFYALSVNFCGFECGHTGATCPEPGQCLLSGCGERTSAGRQASRTYLGPRTEINPFTGVWTCEGSHFAGGQPDCFRRHSSSGHGPIDHMTRIKDEDLLVPGAQFFYDAYYIIGGWDPIRGEVFRDEDLSNNMGWKPVTFTWNAEEDRWSASSRGSGTPPTYGVILNETVWGDEHVTIDTGEGDVIVAMASTDVGGGTWHYEYAVFNLNYNRRIRSFSVLVGQGANVTDIGFHDPDLEGYDGTDWVATVADGSVTWETDTYDQNPDANAIIFATLYNFWFDADAPPEPNRVTMEPYLPGPPGTVLAALITGPAGWVPGDFDGDGDVDLDDFGTFAACYNGANNPPAPSCPPGVNADLDGDGDVDLDDFGIFAANYTGSY